ncbi:hypothetical protein H696_05971 [Fonticula alba]|uniref:Sulfotransferase domain-containing protein n=1 Tax=Fonticula alba TaxID=691883 RepID=A0A058Z0Y3_FONAL|nr:hypothetical protein H696_05971 [Fonticula alba]KCV67573.1 hypothetical protein H696_05971 [Fonticula alba]|eukprot:XP_009498014.1 hypothetical protein H696_05971 [Fonticula alba]
MIGVRRGGRVSIPLLALLAFGFVALFCLGVLWVGQGAPMSRMISARVSLSLGGNLAGGADGGGDPDHEDAPGPGTAVRRPWFNNDIRLDGENICRQAAAGPRDEPLDGVAVDFPKEWGVFAIGSYPRSGNSFLRLLLEKWTGVCTGSLYNDHRLRNSGWRCEGLVDTDTVLFVKSHDPMFRRHAQELEAPFERVIHIIRNPFDSIRSYYHLEQTGTHDFHDDKARPEKWDYYARKQPGLWLENYRYWAAFKDRGVPYILIRYEDLRANPWGELERVLRWLVESSSVGDLEGSLATRPEYQEVRERLQRDLAHRLATCAIRYNPTCALPICELERVLRWLVESSSVGDLEGSLATRPEYQEVRERLQRDLAHRLATCAIRYNPLNQGGVVADEGYSPRREGGGAGGRFDDDSPALDMVDHRGGDALGMGGMYGWPRHSDRRAFSRAQIAHVLRTTYPVLCEEREFNYDALLQERFQMGCDDLRGI